MNRYICYIKSHCEAPDFEMEVEADSKDEAVKIILSRCKHFEEVPEYDFIAEYTAEI